MMNKIKQLKYELETQLKIQKSALETIARTNNIINSLKDQIQEELVEPRKKLYIGKILKRKGFVYNYALQIVGNQLKLLNINCSYYRDGSINKFAIVHGELKHKGWVYVDDLKKIFPDIDNFYHENS